MTSRPIMGKLGGLVAVLLAVLAGGCGGGDDLITATRSERLLSLLDEAEQQFEEGECDELTATLTQLAEQVNAVPDDVDPNVRTTLSSETQRLIDLGRECQPAEEPEPVAPVPEPPPTAPAPAPTAPPPTEPEETQEEEEEEEEEDNDGNDGSSSNRGPGGTGPPGQDGSGSSNGPGGGETGTGDGSQEADGSGSDA